jgi:hypothetical protein
MKSNIYKNILFFTTKILLCTLVVIFFLGYWAKVTKAELPSSGQCCDTRCCICYIGSIAVLDAYYKVAKCD